MLKVLAKIPVGTYIVSWELSMCIHYYLLYNLTMYYIRFILYYATWNELDQISSLRELNGEFDWLMIDPIANSVKPIYNKTNNDSFPAPSSFRILQLAKQFPKGLPNKIVQNDSPDVSGAERAAAINNLLGMVSYTYK